MLVSDFNYDLPEERIAKFPPKERGTTRLLVLDRKSGEVKDSFYRNLDELLNPGDLLILNDTRVMQSRLFCELPDGRERELVVLEKHGDEPQRVMYRGKLRDGDVLFIKFEGIRSAAARGRAPAAHGDGPAGRGPRIDEKCIRIKHILGNGIAEVESKTPLSELAEKYGTVPLPPYLHRDATDEDKKRYQTVWAKNMGSAAAPTASLNMTEDLMKRLQDKGVIIKYLTLHVGLGTFLPMRTDNVEDHKMHSEWFNIPDDTLAEIKHITDGWPSLGDPQPSLCEDGGKCEDRTRPKIIAVGTTVARTLEYYAKTGKTSGEDDIFIYPGFEFKIVDALLTNFHAPKSTVLMLASAFAGWDHLHHAYDYAVSQKYNFLSYGDSMFIC
ncbi:S-adenosylmethionine:tRNA ribosyltransferase-isomerase [Candidatus Saccharibacteria bacterium]|nr:S-adenosylmethionine:tRNA ribosyltransferase-isomerase [Candidatus Saccharibacteria bacterium]